MSNDNINFLYDLVPESPTGFTAKRLSSGLAHVMLSWSSVFGATGYEIYAQQFSYTPVSVFSTTLTAVNITSGLYQGNEYTYYIVSYMSNNSLPSNSTSVTISIGK